MSKLTTTTSTTRPSNPVDGTVLYETDTNRILFWDGSAYHIYNRDTISYPTGGVDDIHYPAGLFTNSSANYYITTTPAFHFDSSFVNGFSANDLADGSWVEHWYDRTNSRYHAKEETGSRDATIDLNVASSISGAVNTRPAITTDRVAYTFQDVGFPADTGGLNFTGFFIQCSYQGALYDYKVTPFGNTGNGSTDRHWGVQYGGAGNRAHKFGGPNISGVDDSELPTDYASGPALRIGRCTAGTNEYWNTVTGGGSPGTSTAVTTNPKYPELLSRYNDGSGAYEQMLTWEIIMFHSALSLAEINTVKDYLQNKYNGLSTSLATSCPDLT
jgi:hypothetical protein